MIEAIKKFLAAAEELGKVTDIDIIDYGNNRKLVLVIGVTEDRLPFELKLEIGVKPEEEEQDK